VYKKVSISSEKGKPQIKNVGGVLKREREEFEKRQKPAWGGGAAPLSFFFLFAHEQVLWDSPRCKPLATFSSRLPLK